MPVPALHAAAEAPVLGDDELLMLRARGGDARAFEGLAHRYASRLVMYCMQFTRSLALAEETAQDTWLGLWSNRASYEPTARFVVLLFTAARNRCRNVHRGNVRAVAALGRPDPDADAVDALSSREPSGLDQLIASERARSVFAGIDALSPPLREAIVLRVVDELSYADIAAIVGIPEATARSRVYLAVQKLRDLARKEPS